MIRILLVDDEAIVRQGWRMRLALEADLVVVGETGSGEDALQLVQTRRPDAVLMDVNLPGMDGLEATRRIRATQPTCQVIVITIQDDAVTRRQAQNVGATAVFSKQDSFDEVVKALRHHPRQMS